MNEALVKAKETLANPKAGWVNRRDAAECLGEAAAIALGALAGCRKDPDVDVRSAVEKMLAKAHAAGGASSGVATNSGASATASGIKSKRVPGTYSLEELARGCEKAGHRTVTERDEGFDVEVTMPNGRHQRVRIAPFERKDGLNMVRILTHCGKPSAAYYAWALQTNMILTHGALAVTGEGADQQFVIVHCYAMSEATPACVKASVKEIAYYGDWLEGKLTGRDVL